MGGPLSACNAVAEPERPFDQQKRSIAAARQSCDMGRQAPVRSARRQIGDPVCARRPRDRSMVCAGPTISNALPNERGRDSLQHRDDIMTRRLSQLLSLERVPGNQTISPPRRLPRNIRLVDEHQIVLREVPESLVPGDGAIRRRRREIESDARASVLYVDRGRSRRRGLARSGLRIVPRRPLPNHLGVVGGHDVFGPQRRVVPVDLSKGIVIRQQ
jgi:hypothetical protein